MLAPPPQILCGLGEEGGEPIFSTSSWLQVPTASPHLHSLTYKVPQADEGAVHRALHAPFAGPSPCPLPEGRSSHEATFRTGRGCIGDYFPRSDGTSAPP